MARRSPRTRGRSVNGILLLDKPTGVTSNTALQEVKRLFQARKAGHTGNLDPLASGLLPICFGEATKLSAFLLDADKYYDGTCKLGVRTRTADAEGEVIERRPVPQLERAHVESVLAGFTGEIVQIPPMHSAVKHQGKPLYKLAHQGIEVERKPRTVTVHAIELLRLEGDEVDIRVHCSKGTYIRTLAEDIGEALGCGAHLSRLRRTGAGPFRLEGAVSLPELRSMAAEEGVEALDGHLRPMDEALGDWPAISLSADAAYYLEQGQPVLVPQSPTAGWVRLFGSNGSFIGVGTILDDGRVAPKRLMNRA